MLYWVNGGLLHKRFVDTLRISYYAGSMFSPERLDVISKLVLDLGKILFAAAVVGFFIPGFSGTVSVSTLISGTILSTSLFVTGIKLTK